MNVSAYLTSEYVHANFQNQKMTTTVFPSILKSILPKSRFIISLDLSLNPGLQDRCILQLEPFIKSAKCLTLLNLEKTGISHISGVTILKAFPKKNQTQSLNFSSNKLGTIFFDELCTTLKSNNFAQLKCLNLSNTGLNDHSAVKLFTSIFHNSNIERIYVSMNNLRYKTGAGVISLLSANTTAKIRFIDLAYTSVSKSLISTINEILQRNSQRNSTRNLIQPNNNNTSQYITNVSEIKLDDIAPNQSSRIEIENCINEISTSQNMRSINNYRSVTPNRTIHNDFLDPTPKNNMQLKKFTPNQYEKNKNMPLKSGRFIKKKPIERPKTRCEKIDSKEQTGVTFKPISSNRKTPDSLKNTLMNKTPVRKQENIKPFDIPKQTENKIQEKGSSCIKNIQNPYKTYRSYSPILITNRNYENIKDKIKNSKNRAQDLHPFYTKRNGHENCNKTEQIILEENNNSTMKFVTNPIKKNDISQKTDINEKSELGQDIDLLENIDIIKNENPLKKENNEIPIKTNSIDFDQASIEFSKAPAQNPEKRLAQINNLVKASNKLLTNWENDEMCNIMDTKNLGVSLSEFTIHSPEKNQPEKNQPENESNNESQDNETENLKLMVADQIQRLLLFYRQISNTPKPILKCNPKTCRNTIKTELTRNETLPRKNTTEGSDTGENPINDRASFMERRKFTLHSNGMIAGGYEEKLCNSLLEGLCFPEKGKDENFINI